MPELVVPSARWLDEYREALREAAEAGEVVPWDPPFDSSDADLQAAVEYSALGIWGPGATDPSQWYRWWVDDAHYLGRVSLRFITSRDNVSFYASHGDIGYDVRPSERGHGVATGMLQAMIRFAMEHDFENLLITCDEANAASRRVIEKNGGIYLDSHQDGPDLLHRFRFSLHPSRTTAATA